MKKIQLYARSSNKGVTLINVSKMKFLHNLLPSEVDLARRFLLISQYNLPEIEPFYCFLNEEQSQLLKKSITYFNQDYKGTYIPVYFDPPTIDRGAIQGLIILKIYINE